MVKVPSRRFLQGTVASLGIAAFYPFNALEAGFMDSLFGRVGQKTLLLTPNGEFYITSYDLTPTIHRAIWKLKIHGLCQNPLLLTYDEVLKRRRMKMVSTLECIGNPVGGFSIGTAEGEGISLKSLREEATVDPKAVDLAIHGEDGYSNSIPMTTANRDDVLLAVHMNGVPLPSDHGYPLRLSAPGIYGRKNVKWITGLEVVPFDYKGHWQKEGWLDEAPVKLSSRIDLPGDRETIASRSSLVRGSALNGIKKYTGGSEYQRRSRLGGGNDASSRISFFLSALELSLEDFD